MTFTPLETAAITGLITLVVALAVHMFTKHHYVSVTQCDERRRTMCQALESIRSESDEMRREIRDRTAVIFRMIRAMIAHDKDLAPEVKAEILNETPNGGK